MEYSRKIVSGVLISIVMLLFLSRRIQVSISELNKIGLQYNPRQSYTPPVYVNWNLMNTPKSILLWTLFFGDNYDRHFSANHSIKKKTISCPEKCIISRDRTQPYEYDAIVFHTRDSQNPPKVRRVEQIYIAYTWESPVYRGNHFVKGNFYNWSATYMRESTVNLKHGVLHNEPAAIRVNQLPQIINHARIKNNSSSVILWVVSHCQPSSKRQNFVKKMKQYIGVDTYGRCGKPCPGGTGRNSPLCYLALAKMGKYKFYLAFENSICKDYISLKAFRALQAGLVPIVLGGMSKDDYEAQLPPNSYIDVRDYKSVKNLTDYLKKLDADDKKYLKYHEWRSKYRIGNDHMHGGQYLCEICKALHNTELMSKRQSFDFGAFWNSGKWCDNSLVGRLTKGQVSVK